LSPTAELNTHTQKEKLEDLVEDYLVYGGIFVRKEYIALKHLLVFIMQVNVLIYKTKEKQNEKWFKW
jgi:hypothetical protein